MRLLSIAKRGLAEASLRFHWIVMAAGGLEEIAEELTGYTHGIFIVSLSVGTLLILLGALLYKGVLWPSYQAKNAAGSLLVSGIALIAFACVAGYIAWGAAYFPSKAVGSEPPVSLPSNPWEPPKAS